MPKVTYKGASRRGETSDYLVVKGKRYDYDVEVEVSAEDAKALQDIEGHKFEVGSDAPARESK